MDCTLAERTSSGDLPLPQPQLEAEAKHSLILRMDNLLVGTLSLPKLPSENSLPSVMSSATSPLWKTFRDHRDHRSGDRA